MIQMRFQVDGWLSLGSQFCLKLINFDVISISSNQGQLKKRKSQLKDQNYRLEDGNYWLKDQNYQFISKESISFLAHFRFILISYW